MMAGDWWADSAGGSAAEAESPLPEAGTRGGRARSSGLIEVEVKYHAEMRWRQRVDDASQPQAETVAAIRTLVLTGRPWRPRGTSAEGSRGQYYVSAVPHEEAILTDPDAPVVVVVEDGPGRLAAVSVLTHALVERRTSGAWHSPKARKPRQPPRQKAPAPPRRGRPRDGGGADGSPWDDVA